MGGSAPYIGLSASKFNIQSAIVSVIGEDFPKKYIELFERHNIDTLAIERINGEKTFFWSGVYHNDMNKRETLATDLNVLEKFNPIVPDKFKDPNVVVLGNLDPKKQLNVIEQIDNQTPLIVLDTMNFWIENNLPELMELIKKVHVITINEEEARLLTKENSLTLAAKKLLKLGPDFVIIKKGEHGALLFNMDNVFCAPAIPLEKVFDPTGAGDTFAGGFAGFLTKTNDFSFGNMKRAVIYGTAIASFSVERFGVDRLLDLKASEINKRLQDFINLTQIEIEISS